LGLCVVASVAALRTADWSRMAWTTAALFWLGKALVLHFAPPTNTSVARVFAYVLLWPGMETRAFLDAARRAKRPRALEVAAVGGEMLGGAALVALAASWVGERDLTLVAVTALAGLGIALLFGVLGASSLFLRAAGVDAPPIFRAPLLADSLSDLWGRRWNRAFHDMARIVVLAPLRERVPRVAAVALVFLLSGLAHDLIVSWPAGGGAGGPTAYFLLQGVGLLVERSAWGARIGIRGGWGGRIAIGVLTLAPLPLLFHAPFVREVLFPFLRALDVG